MKEEKLRILKLVEEGKISAGEAAKLLGAVEREPSGTRGKAKWFKVRVYERDREEPKVKVNVPLSLLRLGARVGGKFAVSLPEKAKEKLREKGIDASSLEALGKAEELLNELAAEGPFKLVDIEEGRERVEVYLE